MVTYLYTILAYMNRLSSRSLNTAQILPLFQRKNKLKVNSSDKNIKVLDILITNLDQTLFD